MVKICPKNKNCAVIYGGGKDAHLTLMSALKQGYKVVCLVTFDAGKTHYDFFSDLKKTEIIKEHAKLLKLKLFTFKIPITLQKCPLKKLLLNVVHSILKRYNIDTIFAGNTEDLQEADIWYQVGKIMNINIELPLKNMNILDLITICTKNKITPLIVAVEKNVNIKWLGKTMNTELINYIKKERKKGNYIDGNDFQTLVIQSPLLKKEMKIIKSRYFSFDTTTYLKIDRFKFV